MPSINTLEVTVLCHSTCSLRLPLRFEWSPSCWCFQGTRLFIQAFGKKIIEASFYPGLFAFVSSLFVIPPSLPFHFLCLLLSSSCFKLVVNHPESLGIGPNIKFSNNNNNNNGGGSITSSQSISNINIGNLKSKSKLELLQIHINTRIEKIEADNINITDNIIAFFRIEEIFDKN